MIAQLLTYLAETQILMYHPAQQAVQAAADRTPTPVQAARIVTRSPLRRRSLVLRLTSRSNMLM
jgi:hypothetical protein